MECPGRQLEHHYFDQLYLELPAACMGDFVFTKHEQIKRCTVDNMIYKRFLHVGAAHLYLTL